MFMDMEIPDFQTRSNDSKNELISSTLDVFGDMCRWLFVRLFFYLLQVVHSCKCSKTKPAALSHPYVVYSNVVNNQVKSMM